MFHKSSFARSFGLLLMTLGFAVHQAFAEPGSSATAQDDLFSMDLEKVIDIEVPSVYAASRYEQSALKAPGSVSILTREDIKLFGWRNIGEALASIPSVHVSNDRNFQFLKVRGYGRGDDFSNNGVLITINGVRMNEGVLGSGTTSRDFPVDIDMIERIEVIRGPGSTVYGSNAFFAVINIITRDAKSLSGGELSGSVGTYDEYKGRASFGTKLDSGFHVNLSASRFNRHGDGEIFFPEFQDPETNNGWSLNENEDDVTQFQFDVGNDKWRFEGYLTDRHAEFPEAPFETEFAAGNSVHHSRQIMQLTFQDEIAKQLELQVKSSYIHFNERGYYFSDFSENDDPLIVTSLDDLESRTFGLETQLRRSFDGGHNLTGGVDIRRHSDLKLSSSEQEVVFGEQEYEPVQVLDRTASSSDIGVYGQADMQVLDQLLFTAGIRYSYYDLVEKVDTLDPRLALIYQPTEATAVKAIYGTAFRNPSAYERLYDDGGFSSIIPESLVPEEIETTELSVEHYFKKNISARLSAYYLRFSDLIQAQVNEDAEALTFGNEDEASIGQGMEAELNAKFENGLRLRASYAYQDNEDGETSRITLNSPRQLAKLNVAVPLFSEDLYGGVELQYVGERFSRDYDKADDYLLVNMNLIALKVPSLEDLELSFGIYNVFDKDIMEPAASWHSSAFIPQEGRTFRAMATLRW